MEKRRVSTKGLLVGTAIDWGGSIVVSVSLSIAFSIVMAISGTSLDETESLLREPFVLIPIMIIGFGFTMLGGFVAGRMAKRSEILHGGIVGGLGIPFGFLFGASIPLWYNLISYMGVIPIGMFGGYLARLRQLR